MSEIFTIGEVLVEVMAKDIDQGFDEPGTFIGPFASGAPAIFIDQATKIGSSGGILSRVGKDGFGQLNIHRLQQDGVDVRFIKMIESKTTGIAFVAYQENGDRDFIFTLKDSAVATLNEDDVREEMFDNCKYFHIMGCSAFNEGIMLAMKKAITIAKKKQIQITFDPNIRKELMEDENVKQFIQFVLKHCDVFLPGEEELLLITGASTEEKAMKLVWEMGISCVVVKKGRNGSRVYYDNTCIDIDPYPVQEIDPTGAGDCFAGTFVSLINQGKSIIEAAQWANAAGAYAVTKKGPMEGTSSLQELQVFIDQIKGGE
ncbi:Sugar or nucleoside kinase, ribokinase family [Seinonella peptonophila]|uniref:Sugar or nucleoside kinase, ribokinase family n=1 Tax=Seinonella peptonophila TaxID=112248 RepID=A0A1M5ACW5_9BACL|nr:sugar kinase [Seinonella peptonophila]SHF28103.1 Sugar or nucleoside kinase, ribokinase family [Seinonella peptonophila]